MDAYEIGIKSFDEATFNERDNAIATGNKITTTGVLLINADKQATTESKISRKCSVKDKKISGSI